MLPECVYIDNYIIEDDSQPGIKRHTISIHEVQRETCAWQNVIIETTSHVLAASTINACAPSTYTHTHTQFATIIINLCEMRERALPIHGRRWKGSSKQLPRRLYLEDKHTCPIRLQTIWFFLFFSLLSYTYSIFLQQHSCRESIINYPSTHTVYDKLSARDDDE